jgi:hypothetical protein
MERISTEYSSMNNELTRALKNINRAANSLEVFSYSALASMSGTYGDEDKAYTQRRMDDVFYMLNALETMREALKKAVEGGK